MKKTLAMIAVLAVAGAAVADIAVEFKNSGGLQYNGGGFIAGEVRTQVIWTDNAIIDTTVLAAGALNAGEQLVYDAVQLLSADNTAAAGFAGFFNMGVLVDDTAGINSGKLILRAFDLDNSGLNSFHGQWNIDVDGTLTDYDSFNTATIYTTNDLIGGQQINNGVQVIPEPATIGLMGIAGLGMFLARRKARR